MTGKRRWGASAGTTILFAAMIGSASIAGRGYIRLAQARHMVVAAEAGLSSDEQLLRAAVQFPVLSAQAANALNQAASRLFPGDSVVATAELRSFVRALADSSGLRIGEVEGREPLVEGALTRVSVSLEAEGAWRNVLSYVRALESSTRLVHVRHLHMERTPQVVSGAENTITVTVLLSGYSQGGMR